MSSGDRHSRLGTPERGALSIVVYQVECVLIRTHPERQRVLGWDPRKDRRERERETHTHTHTHREGIKQKNICERILSDLGEKFCFKVHSLGPPYQCPGSSGHFEPSAALFSSPLWLTPKPQGLIKCL